MTFIVGGVRAGARGGRSRPRMGARTALVTHKTATIGEMSCNPAIARLGKAHLVREIDALHGLMGGVADKAGIKFRVLNPSKGPPRARHARAGGPQALSRRNRSAA